MYNVKMDHGLINVCAVMQSSVLLLFSEEAFEVGMKSVIL
jgi:hypothetical protein